MFIHLSIFSLFGLSFGNPSTADWLSKLTSTPTTPVTPVIPVDPSTLLNSLKQLQAQWASKTATHTPPTHTPKPPTHTPKNPTTTSTPSESDTLNLACSSRWNESRKILSSIFSDPATLLLPLSTNDTHYILSSLSPTLPPPTPEDECGLANLSIQILQQLAAIPDSSPSAIIGKLLMNEPLHSPIMTVLVDIPWGLTRVSEWPYFALMCQWSLMNRMEGGRGIDGRDGLMDEVLVQFYNAIVGALENRDLNLLSQVSYTFLEAVSSSPPADPSSPSPLSIIASQQPLPLAISFLGTSLSLEGREKMEMIDRAQEVVKSMIHGPLDLSYVLNTSWPLFMVLGLALF